MITTGSSSTVAKPVRPRELEDALNYHLYHPLAWQLARALARTPLTPNMVSVIGGGFVIAAAVAYAQPGWPLPALLGMLLHMTWHVVDGADGDLARLTGRASPIGEMVDGICDYCSHIVLYLVLGWLLAGSGFAGWSPLATWTLVVLAGASHIAQANHVEVQRRSFQWWVYDKPWLRVTHEHGEAATRKGGLGGLAAFYLGVASGVAGNAALIDAEMAAAAHDPARRERIRTAARRHAQPLLQFLKILGPNPRAIVLGLSMLAGSPAYYFLYQVVVLNLLLAWSMHLHNQAARRMLAMIDAG
ncbi:MAG: CDP-alcohol phosphatidyltransferase family protein [Sphingomonadales bacterium]|nr:CDP-alcohol phosphatidyltransferase family protein [Sphingomonadales bacterium]